MRRIDLHPEADTELLEAASAYREVSTELLDDFRLELKTALRLLSERPEACPLVGGDVRRKPLRRFPFILFFTVGEDSIQVWAVAHQRRRPGYWSERVRLRRRRP